MATLLLGKPVREHIISELRQKMAKLLQPPVLVVVQVGERSDSSAYIKQKQKFGEELGIETRLLQFPDHVRQEDLEEEIHRLNADKKVTGLIVQLPLPESMSSEAVMNLVDPKKDADGLAPDSKVLPATAVAVLRLLDYYQVTVWGKRVAVIGRSKLAGGPIAKLLESRGAKVSICHRQTTNMAEVCKASDILVSAAGQVGLVTKDFVREGQVVIDVGINRLGDKLVGDVNFAEVEPIVAAITPVPGGVGPLTVACLFQNLFDLSE